MKYAIGFDNGISKGLYEIIIAGKNILVVVVGKEGFEMERYGEMKWTHDHEYVFL